MKNCIIVFASILLFIMPINGSAQEENLLKTNNIYGSVGVGGLYFTASGYYEKILKQGMWSKNISCFVKAGGGGYALWGVGGQFALGQFGFLTGSNTHHLEVSAGPAYIFNGDLFGMLPVSGAIGWRIQKPGKHFIYRMGAAWPEAGYISLGFAF